jgi:hypothetical protein
LALVGAGVGLRLVFRDIPNAAPVAALALFAGYFLRSPWMALAVPLSVMAVSDWFLGGYAWQMMALVYGMLAMPVAMRPWLRRAFRLHETGAGGPWAPTAGLVGSSLACSVLFFVVTNFGVWLMFGTYAPTLEGLWHCYLSAIPFFRYTLAGDLGFALVLFGGYAAVTALASRRVTASQLG